MNDTIACTLCGNDILRRTLSSRALLAHPVCQPCFRQHNGRICGWCGGAQVEVFSDSDSDSGGWHHIHLEGKRVGDGAPLGRKECADGQLRWGA